MELKEWDRTVKPFLMEIREHASWIAPHALALGIAARNLPIAPDFETRAEDELTKAEQALESALNVVRDARHRFVGLRVMEAAE
jgi:hypothetical protein